MEELQKVKIEQSRIEREVNGMENKIVQIIPVPENLFSKSYIEEGVWVYLPIVCMGLTSCGDIEIFNIDDNGNICKKHSGEVFKYSPDLDEYVQLYDFEKE